MSNKPKETKELQPNREYKDQLFRAIFSSRKDWLLDLYNAVNDTDYTNVDDLDYDIIDGVIYVSVRSDISFIFDCNINLYEHQSTYNPNMPMRGLIYFSILYRQYAKVMKTDYFSSTLVKVPTPRYAVFYNGDRRTEEVTKLRLSDAFINKDDSGEFEWTATMYNINYDANKRLLKKCKVLHDYSLYVHKVREYSKTMKLAEAVARAVDDAIKENLLDGYFYNHSEGVLNMTLLEIDMDEFMQNRERDGERRGKRKAYIEMYNDGDITADKAARKLNISVEDFFNSLEQRPTNGDVVEILKLHDDGLNFLTISARLSLEPDAVQDIITAHSK